MSRASCRLGVPCALVVGASLLGGGVPAAAQGPPAPPGVPDAYALLAFDKMDVSGPISLQTGSVGVNDKDGQINAFGGAPLDLNALDGVIAARKVSLQDPPRVRRSSPTLPLARNKGAGPCRARSSPRGSLRSSRASGLTPSATCRIRSRRATPPGPSS
jgi:hypothetical protein